MELPMDCNFTVIGTHVPVLSRMMQVTSGPILELGVGDMSTPLIHMGAGPDRIVVSVDNSPDWLDRYREEFESDTHKFFYIQGSAIGEWKNVQFDMHKWSFVFIDNDNTERKGAIERVREHADYLVIHDTNHNGAYNFWTEIESFKYRYDYTRWHDAWTTIVSDKYEIPFPDLKNSRRNNNTPPEGKHA